jgi:hypothetical protein
MSSKLAALVAALVGLALSTGAAASPVPLVVVVQAPDGTAIVPVSSFAERHRILPSGTALVEHADAAVRAVPAIHVTRGDELLFRLSPAPTEVKIAHRGAPYGETVAPAGEVRWSGTAFLDGTASVGLCRGESVRGVLGHPVSRVRGTGFGRGPLTLVERESGTLAWTLRRRRAGRAVLSVRDAVGAQRDYAFTYRVSRCA